MIKWFCFIVILWLPFTGFGQSKDLPPYRYKNNIFIIGPDSLPHVLLPEIPVFPERKDMSRKQLRQTLLWNLKLKRSIPLQSLPL